MDGASKNPNVHSEHGFQEGDSSKVPSRTEIPIFLSYRPRLLAYIFMVISWSKRAVRDPAITCMFQGQKEQEYCLLSFKEPSHNPPQDYLTGQNFSIWLHLAVWEAKKHNLCSHWQHVWIKLVEFYPDNSRKEGECGCWMGH